jgi:hypothetical protein
VAGEHCAGVCPKPLPGEMLQDDISQIPKKVYGCGLNDVLDTRTVSSGTLSIPSEV